MVKLNEVKDANEFPLRPVGLYHVRIHEASRGIGKASGKPYVKVQLKIIDGEHIGGVFFKNISLNEKALPFLKPFLLAINVPEDYDLQIEDGIVKINEQSWNNEQLLVFIDHRVFEGKTQEEIKFYKSLSSEGKKLIGTKTEDEEIPF